MPHSNRGSVVSQVESLQRQFAQAPGLPFADWLPAEFIVQLLDDLDPTSAASSRLCPDQSSPRCRSRKSAATEPLTRCHWTSAEPGQLFSWVFPSRHAFMPKNRASFRARRAIRSESDRALDPPCNPASASRRWRARGAIPPMFARVARHRLTSLTAGIAARQG